MKKFNEFSKKKKKKKLSILIITRIKTKVAINFLKDFFFFFGGGGEIGLALKGLM